MERPRYLVLDIETAPLDYERHKELAKDHRTDLLNPIDSRVVAAGIRCGGEDFIFANDEEDELLKAFWAQWKISTKGDPTFGIVGFNLKNFDLPFLVNRSFINSVTIHPFKLKPIIDIREKVNAYKYGKTRGKLKEYAKMFDLPVLDVDGSDVADLYYGGKMDTIDEYLRNDLMITDELYKRLVSTKVVMIDRW